MKFAAAIAAIALIAVPAASAKKPWHPNTRAQVQSIVKALDGLSSFGQQFQRGGDGEMFLCRFVDDAPTKKSLDHSAVIYYCVPVASLKPAPKPKPSAS